MTTRPEILIRRAALTDLEAITEMPQRAADGDTFGRLRQVVETGGRRARQDRLADSVDELSPQSFGIECKEQHADAGPSVGRIVGSDFGFDARFDLASNHRRGEAGHGLGRRFRPCR